MIQPTLLGDELETEPTIRMPGQQNCWAIVLAGGEGLRLRPLVRQVLGDDRPKQYVRLLGARTLLRQTLDRIGLAIPETRTLVVTVRHHAGYVAEEFPELCEAELAAMAALLGTHVQRLATIANGDFACTTHVPLSPAR